MFAYFNRILDGIKIDDPVKGSFKKSFIPEPDITTWELAEILSNLGAIPLYGIRHGGVDFTPKVWDGLVWGVKRHFKDMPE
jgi:hypothetical protein